VLLSKRTETDFQAWRDRRDWIAHKCAIREHGEKLVTQTPSSMMRCSCGEVFDSHDPTGSYTKSPIANTSMPSTKTVKFAELRPFTDPEAAARKIVEIANAAQAVQDGRIHIEGHRAFPEGGRQPGRVPRWPRTCAGPPRSAGFDHGQHPGE
jgi:hypothetical protein